MGRVEGLGSTGVQATPIYLGGCCYFALGSFGGFEGRGFG